MRKDHVVTITLNPCIDKAVTVAGFVTGELNRITSVRYDLSGKGINLSFAYHALGGKTTASGIMYANEADTYRKVLAEKGIGYDFVEVPGRVRENLKVSDAKTSCITEINEPGGRICETDIARLADKISALAKDASIVAFSGSLPLGAPKDIYQKLGAAAKAVGALTVLDSDGEAFKLGLRSAPDIIKPNLFELEQISGKPLNSQADIASAAMRLVETFGVHFAAVTLGEKGAMLMSENAAYYAEPLKLNVRSATGAGDTFVAGMLTALRLERDEKAMLVWGMAAAGDAVTREGTQVCTLTGTEDLLKRVKVTAL